MWLRRSLLIFGRGFDKFQIIFIPKQSSRDILTRYVREKVWMRKFNVFPRVIIISKLADDVIIKRNSKLCAIIPRTYTDHVILINA